MGHYRRRVREDLADLMLDALRAVRDDVSPDAIRAKAEREILRERLRDERRARQASVGRLRLISTGAGLLTGGLAATIMPTVAAVGLALMVGGGLFYVLKALINRASEPRIEASAPRMLPKQVLAPEVDGASLPKSRRELVQSILDQAAADLTKLARAGSVIASHNPETAAAIARLVASGERLSDAVADEPARFELAQRVFTYHLPKAVFVAETYPTPDSPNYPRRSAEARHVLTRMEMMFEKTTLELSHVDSAEMDLELRLINQALDEDLGERVAAPRTERKA